jgi:hypothetical protein
LKWLFLDVVTADQVKVDEKDVEPNAGAVDTVTRPGALCQANQVVQNYGELLHP